MGAASVFAVHPAGLAAHGARRRFRSGQSLHLFARFGGKAEDWRATNALFRGHRAAAEYPKRWI